MLDIVYVLEPLSFVKDFIGGGPLISCSQAHLHEVGGLLRYLFIGAKKVNIFLNFVLVLAALRQTLPAEHEVHEASDAPNVC